MHVYELRKIQQFYDNEQKLVHLLTTVRIPYTPKAGCLLLANIASTFLLPPMQQCTRAIGYEEKIAIGYIQFKAIISHKNYIINPSELIFSIIDAFHMNNLS